MAEDKQAGRGEEKEGQRGGTCPSTYHGQAPCGPIQWHLMSSSAAWHTSFGAVVKVWAPEPGPLWANPGSVILNNAAAAKSLQLCPTLCDPIDGSPRGSPVPGILQARTLEWVAISFSNAWKWKVKVKSLSLVWLLATPWTAAYQAPPSMGFSRQEYWSGVPLPSPEQC